MFEIRFKNWFGSIWNFEHCSSGFRIMQKTDFCITRLSELMSLKRFQLVRSSELVSLKRFQLIRLSEDTSLKRESLEVIVSACGRIGFLMVFKVSWDSLTMWRSFPMENGSVCDRYAYIPKIDCNYNFAQRENCDELILFLDGKLEI